MIVAQPGKDYTVAFRATNNNPSYYTLLNKDGSVYKIKSSFSTYFDTIAVASINVAVEWEGLIKVENADNSQFVYDTISVAYPINILEGAGE